MRPRHPFLALLLVVLLSLVGVAPAASAAWTAVDVVGPSGLGASTETWEAVPVDYDNDGDQDVWVGYHDQGGKLWANNGSGAYTRVASGAWPKVNSEGKIPDRHDCAWADVDRNGLKDAYCAAGRGGQNSVKYGKDNELWLQTKPGQFTDVGTKWGLGELCGRSHYVAFLKANGDAYPDLFVGNAPPRAVKGDPCDDPASGLPNEQMKLFTNNGGTGFTYAAGSGIGGYGGARGAEVVDFDRDGWDDLLVLGNPGPRLFRNKGGNGFTDVTSTNGLNADFSDAAFGDLDRDGDPDLVTAVWGEFAYRLNNGGRYGAKVRIASVPTGGGGRSVSLGDADRDGDLDVYGLVSNATAGTNPADMVLLNSALTFTKIGVPAAGGIGDAVTPLDGNKDGQVEFLVLNGVETVGPIQLIRLRSS